MESVYTCFEHSGKQGQSSGVTPRFSNFTTWKNSNADSKLSSMAEPQERI